MAELVDSGVRRSFDSGAVRDVAEGKGRCDLLPLSSICAVLENAHRNDLEYILLKDILYNLDKFIYTGILDYVKSAVICYVDNTGDDYLSALLDLSIHYEDGCRKYGERNWEKGIPVHCYIDSGIRHLFKYLRGDIDEPHDRAFLWNMLGLIWTVEEFVPKHTDLSDYILDTPGFQSND